jgi:hypothetical protein
MGRKKHWADVRLVGQAGPTLTGYDGIMLGRILARNGSPAATAIEAQKSGREQQVDRVSA